MKRTVALLVLLTLLVAVSSTPASADPIHWPKVIGNQTFKTMEDVWDLGTKLNTKVKILEVLLTNSSFKPKHVDFDVVNVDSDAKILTLVRRWQDANLAIDNTLQTLRGQLATQRTLHDQAMTTVFRPTELAALGVTSATPIPTNGVGRGKTSSLNGPKGSPSVPQTLPAALPPSVDANAAFAKNILYGSCIGLFGMIVIAGILQVRLSRTKVSLAAAQAQNTNLVSEKETLQTKVDQLEQAYRQLTTENKKLEYNLHQQIGLAALWHQSAERWRLETGALTIEIDNLLDDCDELAYAQEMLLGVVLPGLTEKLDEKAKLVKYWMMQVGKQKVATDRRIAILEAQLFRLGNDNGFFQAKNADLDDRFKRQSIENDQLRQSNQTLIDQNKTLSEGLQQIHTELTSLGRTTETIAATTATSNEQITNLVGLLDGLDDNTIRHLGLVTQLLKTGTIADSVEIRASFEAVGDRFINLSTIGTDGQPCTKRVKTKALYAKALKFPPPAQAA